MTTDAERLAEIEAGIYLADRTEYQEWVRDLLDCVKALEAENARMAEAGKNLAMMAANAMDSNPLTNAVFLEEHGIDLATVPMVHTSAVDYAEVARLRARIQEQEAEIARLTAAGLSAESKWADAVDKMREQEAVIQALRAENEILRDFLADMGSRVGLQEPVKAALHATRMRLIAALNSSSATDGEQQKES